jgi:hypothetical protein
MVPAIRAFVALDTGMSREVVSESFPHDANVEVIGRCPTTYLSSRAPVIPKRLSS